MRHSYFTLLFIAIVFNAFAQNISYQTKSNVPYYTDKIILTDEYANERCKLDIYYPENQKGFATVVWFHGGGLTGGEKEIPTRLLNQGLCVVAPNYRLYPKIKCPTYIEDAAAAVAWVFNHINDLGGDSTLIFISGHSAGGYLASMVGMDKQYLQKHAINANNIAGLIPFSGHTITHFTVREERGISGTQPIIDEMAPLFHVRKDAPPLLLITGDRTLEMLGRYEENAYMMRMMQVVDHDTRIMEMDGYGHGMVEPALPLLINEVQRIVDLHKK